MIASLVLAALVWPASVTENCPNIEAESIKIVGVARNAGGQFLYCEIIRPIDENQIDIDYTKDGKLFATKNINFKDSPHAPEITQLDIRSGEKREVSGDTNNLYLKYQPNKNKKMIQKKIAKKDIHVIDAGFDNFMRAHWNELDDGRVLSINFGSVVHQKNLSLLVRKQPSEKCAIKSEDNKNFTCFWVDIDNALLRLILGNIKLTYDQKYRLHQFNGVVNLQLDGDNQTATISYFYSEDYKQNVQ